MPRDREHARRWCVWSSGCTAGGQRSLPGQLVHGDDLLGDLDQFLLATHRLAAHQGVGLLPPCSRASSSACPWPARCACVPRVAARGPAIARGSPSGRSRTRHRHIEDWLEPLGLNALDDIGADPCADGLTHGIRVTVVGEHDDGPWLIAADQHHLPSTSRPGEPKRSAPRPGGLLRPARADRWSGRIHR